MPTAAKNLRPFCCARSAALTAAFVIGFAINAVFDTDSANGNGQSAPSAGTILLRPAHPADVLRVIDGDTFEARVRVWPGIEITTKVRLRGIDAPELTRPRCEEERSRAVAARDALQALLDQGDVQVSAVSLDKYGGRVVAEITTRLTPNVAAALLEAAHARPYAGGRRESWCP